MLLASLTLLVIVHAVSSWDPDAGLVTSWTKKGGVTANASTGNNPGLVLDGNDNTHWTSAACLPTEFLLQPNVNVLLNLCQTSACQINGGTNQDVHLLTDGSVYTTSQVAVGQNNGAKVSINTIGKDITQVSIWGIYNGDTVLKAVDILGAETSMYTFNQSDNYQRRTFAVTTTLNQIILKSAMSFSVKEIAAVGHKGCQERIVVDLGVLRRIGVVRTRHWAGTDSAYSTSLLMSADGQTWDTVQALQPTALQAVQTRLQSPTEYRYIAINYDVKLKNHNKVYCWEIDAYDEYGIWGPAPKATANPVSIRQMLGVNGIWGWGHNPNGPTLYSRVASYARNYHNLNWDVKDPDFDPQFEQMGQGNGTNAFWWLNWDKEYSNWRSAGLKVDTSIQFLSKTFPASVWNTPSQSAYRYGREFGRHFGPQIGNGLVTAMEVGNEPWDYSADFYATVLEGMTAGVRDVDQIMDVLPGAFQAYIIAPEEPTSGNYIGNRVRSAVATNISVVNTHAYSFVTDESGKRVATYPEHPDSTFNSVRNMIRWRDVNTPCKPVWLTEWGWDADGGYEDCAATECVTEDAQALYGARGLFLAARLGLGRATWYFYANTDTCNTLFCRSGLTTTAKHNFTEKAVFHMFESVLGKLGESHFRAALSEDKHGYVYLFGPTNIFQKVTHIVAWLPLGASDVTTTSKSVMLPVTLKPTATWRLTGTDPALQDEALPHVQGLSITLALSTKPLIVKVTSPDPVVTVG
ncbi:uncharacterized protein LOC110458598 [Mizuhopecten yessoensis]|uniref:F5/8 type C domain-containing protein n=1 Tax=Mizuhopecten yessoensis TaxID=6573 RepID=A0A210Q6C5_MIZYE|nr:uncharacterized protein LOC110458598 [Mizuhopecten yessoensis]OWF44288.1 hypothetical protein KP79_PYT15821 [Mizuhopecten yessoensis]